MFSAHRKKSILITGGCGMIGSNLVRRLLKDGWDVSVADNLWRGKIDYLYDEDGKALIDLEKDFYRVDLCDREACERVVGRTDYIVHLAARVAGIEYVFENQGDIFRINNLINSNVFHAARKAGRDRIKGIIYVGTACSFPMTRQNMPDPEPLREDELFPAYPESAYGWSKLMGQLELEYLEKETGIPCCTLILHNVYGSPTDYGERSQVIPALIRKAVNFPVEEYVVLGNGKQERAFIHVDDVIEAFVLALEKGWGKGCIQIGPSYCTSIREVVETVIGISGKKIQPHFDVSRPEGNKARCADYSKAREILGWEPRIKLEEGLSRSYKWIEDSIRKDRVGTTKEGTAT
ncbi:MAG: NAD-dependent epimerase/dehydratase family protein [Lachnospiraceae bacterium]|nr:NAD-dependent epimerase/dehydratase family protein [Lachnospiraceae bacterium]